MSELRDLVRAWSIRARIQLSLRWMFAGLTAGLGAGLLLALAARLAPLADPPALMQAGVALAAAGLAAALSWPWLSSRRRSLADWAWRFDQQFGLAERLSTAFALHSGALPSRDEILGRLQQQDALAVARAIDARAALPVRVPWRHGLAALAALALLIPAIGLPNPQQDILAGQAETRRALAAQAQALEAVRQDLQQSPFLDDAQKAEAIRALGDAQQALAAPGATPEQAVAALNDAQARIDALKDQDWQARRDDLRRSAQALAPDALTNRLAESLSRSDMEQAAQDLRDLTRDGGQTLDGEDQQRLADQLDQLARGLNSSDPQAAQRLREAAAQLRAGDAQAAQDQLDQVARELERSSRQEAATRAIEQTQAQVDDARRAVAQASDRSPDAAGSRGSQPQPSHGKSGAPQASAKAGQAEAGASQSSQAQSGDGQAGAPAQQAMPGHHEDTGSASSVWAPGPRLNPDGSPIALPGQGGQNQPDPSGQASQGQATGATVPYQQVYRGYARAADEAMRGGTIPPGLRETVRAYFSSLDPD
jgi:hypothetical protein